MMKKAAQFKDRLIFAMHDRGFKQVDLARATGLDKSQISQYKSGKNEPMQDALYKIAEALSVNVAWLMGYDVPMDKASQTVENVTEVEHRLLMMFRTATEDARKSAMMVLECNQSTKKDLSEKEIC